MGEYELYDSQTNIVIDGPKQVIFLDGDGNPSRVPLCRISLEFKYELKELYYDLTETPGEGLLGFNENIKVLPDIHVDFEILDTEKNNENTCKEIFRILYDALVTNCGIPVSEGEYIARSFIERFQETLDNIPELTRTGSMTFLVDLEQKYFYGLFLRESGNDDDCNSMIPASYAAIKTLERKRLEDYEDNVKITEDFCAICLDNIKRNSEVCNLPCSHIFHGDCIIEWLNTSHYCPVCRFKMPTGEADEVCSTD